VHGIVEKEGEVRKQVELVVLGIGGQRPFLAGDPDIEDLAVG